MATELPDPDAATDNGGIRASTRQTVSDREIIFPNLNFMMIFSFLFSDFVKGITYSLSIAFSVTLMSIAFLIKY